MAFENWASEGQKPACFPFIFCVLFLEARIKTKRKKETRFLTLPLSWLPSKATTTKQNKISKTKQNKTFNYWGEKKTPMCSFTSWKKAKHNALNVYISEHCTFPLVRISHEPASVELLSGAVVAMSPLSPRTWLTVSHFQRHCVVWIPTVSVHLLLKSSLTHQTDKNTQGCYHRAQNTGSPFLLTGIGCYKCLENLR